MSQSTRTILLFVGLPYTGKTTIIQCLQRELPGEAIYADQIFTRSVPSAEISLERWLRESSHLVASIQSIIQNSNATRFYVELGIMPARQRHDLIRWAQAERYRVVRLWLQCNDFRALRKRQQARVREIGEGGRNGARIDITLDELYKRIGDAFEEPTAEEAFLVIDTEQPLEENLATIRQLLVGEGKDEAGRH